MLIAPKVLDQVTMAEEFTVEQSGDLAYPGCKNCPIVTPFTALPAHRAQARFQSVFDTHRLSSPEKRSQSVSRINLIVMVPDNKNYFYLHAEFFGVPN